MGTPKRLPRVLDLFAGGGGLSLGLHWAGCRTIVAVDHEPTAVETVAANFADHGTTCLLRDLATKTPRELRTALEEEGINPEFDIVAGGPPCQGFSRVGQGKLRSLREQTSRAWSQDPRNVLFRHFVDIVSEFMPRAVLMENVPGMLNHEGQNVAREVEQQLDRAGYTVSSAILDAADFGVPQHRQRVFFVGVRKDMKLKFEFAGLRRLKAPITVWDAIGDLPPIQAGEGRGRRPYGTRPASKYALSMREGGPDELFDHVCRSHNEQDLQAFRLMPMGGIYADLPKHLKRYRDDIFEDKYRRLYKSRPSWTLTAHLSKDCYSHIHPTQQRTISVREAARLQSFPDGYYFGGTMGTKFKLIGNSVAPVMAQALGRQLVKQLFFNVVNGARSGATDGT